MVTGGASAVTVTDIAHFRPEVGGQGSEPSGWAVTGVPANIFSTAGVHVQSGTVLGVPARVRFTPVGWAWDYGDGHTLNSTVAGARWRDLGVEEFDATPTSHVFEEGRFVVRLVVTFRAEYQFVEGDWVDILGVVEAEAPPIEVTSIPARTVLVDADCRTNPHGPGC